MDKKIKKEILEKIFSQNELDNEIQNRMDKLSELYFPDTWAPFIEWKIHFSLKLLKYFTDDKIIDWIEYFLYDADDFYPNCNVWYDWEEFIIKNKKEAIEFLIDKIWK